MAPKTRIAELASIIQENMAIVDEYLTSNGLASPSFDESYPPVIQLPDEISTARDTACEASEELNALLMGPVSSIYFKLTRSSLFSSIGAIGKLNLVNSFAPNTTTNFAEMAAFCKQPESAVQRIVRHAIYFHCFAEPTKGTIAHTAMSRALASFPHLSDALEEFRGTLWPTAPRLVDAMLRWPDSDNPNETAFNLSAGTDLTFWEYYAKHPEKAQRFAGAMTFLAKKPGREKEFLIDSVDWAASLSPPESTGHGTIVDVGGSHGGIALALAERLPSAKLVVQDVPNVISGALKDANPSVEFQVHDFLKAQPVIGADVYILRQILHDWSDKHCRTILAALIPALKPGARIVINDTILPDVGTVSAMKEGMLRHSDMMMWRCFNAKERDEDDWRALVKSTDKRFETSRVFTPPGTYLGIVEVVWKGEEQG